MKFDDMEIMPREIYIEKKNMLEITFQSIDFLEGEVIIEFRIKRDEKMREKYVVGKKTINKREISQDHLKRIKWEVFIPKDFPVSFSSCSFSIEYVVCVFTVENNRKRIIGEIPLTVLPGEVSRKRV